MDDVWLALSLGFILLRKLASFCHCEKYPREQMKGKGLWWPTVSEVCGCSAFGTKVNISRQGLELEQAAHFMEARMQRQRNRRGQRYAVFFEDIIPGA